VKNRPRAVLGAVSSIHFLHDGFSETLYVFLPLWAREFGLTFAQVGLIRSAYTGGMSAFQIPAGLLAERRQGRWVTYSLDVAEEASDLLEATLTVQPS